MKNDQNPMVPFDQFSSKRHKQGAGQAVARIRPDVFAYAVYVASAADKSISEILDSALRFAFNSARFQPSVVQNIVFEEAERRNA